MEINTQDCGLKNRQAVTPEFAELVGIMLGDGCLSRSSNKYLIYISGHKIDDYEYHLKNTKSLFLKVFNKEIKLYQRKDENTLFIRFSDKVIFGKFKEIGLPIGKKYSKIRIPDGFQDDTNFVPFMRGIVDTDGCIVLAKQHRKKPYYPRIEITSISRDFLFEMLSGLRRLGFYGSVSNKGRGFRLELAGFKNLELWMRRIGFNNPKHRKKIPIVNSKYL